MTNLSDRLKALAECIDRAAEIALQARQQMKAELKPDGSIVTNADRAVEEFLRLELSAQWPGTSFWGEEFGRDAVSDKGHWLIDPIDGTSNFRFGSPLWGISVGLAVGDRMELGAVWLPVLGEFYLAERGKGAWMNGQPLSPIPPGPIEAHQLLSYCDSIVRRYSTQAIPGKMRCAGAFVIDGTFTAMQRYRGMIGGGEYLYDAAASILINEELGAEIRWADGKALDYAELIAGKRFDRAWIIFPSGSGFHLSETV
ncbi:MAG: hypothetical protein H7Y17_14840 [Chlorobia bacterium]|nr:hypothetical protein [Fimbriimonadaceae bacterium]